MNIKDYEVKGTKCCECGYEFTIKDFAELKRINEPGFYANQVKHYSPAICPNCHKEIILLLKQVGQTYVVVDIAIKKEKEDNSNTGIEPTIKNDKEKETSKEFICPECQKVCKNQLGLNAHIRTHNK